MNKTLRNMMLATAMLLMGTTASAITTGDAVTVPNGDFSSGTTGWTLSTGKLTAFNKTFDGTTVYGVEAYQSTFDLYQTLTGLDNGVYKIKIQGFCRPGKAAATYTAYTGGSYDETTVKFWVYGNGTEQRMKNIQSEPSETAYAEQNVQVASDANIPDGTKSAAEAFYNDLYWNEVEVFVTDGTLKLGVKGTSDVGRWWCTFGNVSVTYVKPLDVTLYSVTFMANGEEVDKINLAKGADITLPADPAVPGYIFKSWQGLPDDMVMPAEDLTITAVLEHQTELVNGDFADGLDGWLWDKTQGSPTVGNGAIECFNSKFDFYQVLTGLTNGAYRLTAQAYQRTGEASPAWTDYSDGTAQVNTYIYMNDWEQSVANIMSEARADKLAGGWVEVSDALYIPNNMAAGAAAFEAGMYQCQLLALVTDGTLRLGIRNQKGGDKYHWSMWDNIELTYLGEQAMPQLTALTIGSDDVLDQLSGTTFNYQMTYGQTSFPKVSAACDAAGILDIKQASVSEPKATITMKTTSGIEVAVYTINFKAGTPATSDDYIYVATPSIEITDNGDACLVTLTCATPDAQIYYTLDGTTPSAGSLLYTEPFSVNSNLTLSVVGMLRPFNYKDSNVAGYIFSNFKTVSGFSFTLTTGDGSTSDLSGDDMYKYIRQSSSNPAFALAGSNYVYSDARFKIKAGEKFQLRVPANAVVKKVTFNSLSENYYNAEEDNYALWSYMRSEGAICHYADTIRSATNTDITIQGHQPGTPIEFSVASCRQVAFSSITIEYDQYNDGQVNLLSTTIANGSETEPSACFTIIFDRNVTLASGLSAVLDGKTIRTVANGSKVRAYYWELPYGTSHTLTLPAGSINDVFDNTYNKDITINFTVKVEPAPEHALFDYVVSTPDELKTALSAIATSNASAEAARKRILILNGDYDMGTQTQTSIKGYNISLIGQSREGVRIYHEGNGGIVGDATLCNESKDFYMQDITIEHASSVRKGNSRGVTVAYSGGNKAILKNVEMISGQDTYVTGDRTYHEDCTIHGTVDFICGGGDNYFYHTDLLIEGGACITAGSHDASTEWGYVFRDCTVKPGTFISGATDGSYALGRPWKNEPRATFVGTKMEILASTKGWNGMSMIPTHFYEYGSVDKNGKSVDLSSRTVKDISENQYTPVLAANKADDYNMYNTVGGDDGWVPTLYTTQVEAPVAGISGSTLQWEAIDNALCYVVFKDGTYFGQTTETSLAVEDASATYTIRSANAMGGLGEASTATHYTGISEASVKVQSTEDIYDLLGRRVANPDKGLYLQNGNIILK